jgi:hypothetical protein
MARYQVSLDLVDCIVANLVNFVENRVEKRLTARIFSMEINIVVGGLETRCLNGFCRILVEVDEVATKRAHNLS